MGIKLAVTSSYKEAGDPEQEIQRRRYLAVSLNLPDTDLRGHSLRNLIAKLFSRAGQDICASVEYRRAAVYELLFELFGRSPTPSDIAGYVSTYASNGFDHVVATALASEAFYVQQSAENPRIFVRRAQQLICGAPLVQELDQVVAQLEQASIGRFDYVLALLSRNEGRCWQARRLWLRLTGMLDPPDELMNSALAGATRDELVRLIADHVRLLPDVPSEEPGIWRAMRRALLHGLSALAGVAPAPAIVDGAMKALQDSRDDDAFLGVFVDAAYLEAALARLHVRMCAVLGRPPFLRNDSTYRRPCKRYKDRTS